MNSISSYARRCTIFGDKTNSFLLNYQDKSTVDGWVEEQVELLGGNGALYKMIDNNMMNGHLDPLFITEHCDIYSWRERFFHKHFPDNSWFTVDFLNDENSNDAFPFDPEDDYSVFITIPYQITRYFDRVMALASAKVEPGLGWLKQEIYFENNEIISAEAECKYDWEALTDFIEGHGEELEKSHCQDINIGFSEVAHMIAEVHKTGPKKLEEIALKLVLSLNLSIESVPAVIKNKADYGMYSVEDDAPDNISDEGRKMFETMKKVFSQ